MNKNNIEVLNYYAFALEDLSEGKVTVEEMEGVLSVFEEIENYTACEGILQAIKDFKSIKNK